MNEAGPDGMSAVESVWDYPRPPRLEATPDRLQVVHRDVTVADTRRALRVLETSHPPVFYLPPGDILLEYLRPSKRRTSFCEFKGIATYWSLMLPGGANDPVLVPDVAWSYPDPSRPFQALKDHLAFYASRVDACFVNGERVQAQAGDFYGGWITSRVRGPFKGGPGTVGW